MSKNPGLKKYLPTGILIIFLICTLFLDIKVTKRTAQSVLDNDASSELVLAHNLYETHRILSKDYKYSSELRVLNTQLIFAVLFNFFSDWETVRITGTLILHLIYVLSFAFMMHQAGQSLNSILLGISLLLLPYCVAYGRIVLYHTYYLPHITIAFSIFGLLFATINYCRKRQKIKCGIAFAAVSVLSFTASLGGARYLASIVLPLLLMITVRLIIMDHFNLCVDAAENKLYYLSFIAISLCSFAGFCINKFILAKHYSFWNTDSRDLGVYYSKLWEDILHQFGFRTRISFFSVLGVFSMLGLIVAVFCFCKSGKAFFKIDDSQTDLKICLMHAMMLSCFLCTASEMIFLGIAVDSRYFLMSSVWAIPLLTSELPPTIIPKKITPRSLFYPACLMIIIINSILNAAFFLNPSGFAKQVYTGLGYENIMIVPDLKHALRFIQENGYEYGFSTNWEAATITEKTNGIPVSAFLFRSDYLEQSRSLTLRSYQDIKADKVFLLLDVTNAQYFPDFEVSFEWKEVYRDFHYVIYDIPHLEELREYFRDIAEQKAARQ